MADGFSLDGLREGVKNRSEELSKDADPRSVETDDSGPRKPFEFDQPDFDRTEAPKDDMRKYWRQFETTPIVRKPVTAFASRVTEPGYYIESEKLDKDQIRELGNWLSDCAIVEGQPGKDFRLLAKKAIIQREVRGTALVEKAPHKSDGDKIAGLKLINPETVEAVTRPNQNILMAPDDLSEYPEAPEAESGGAAAWLQDVLESDNNHQWGTPVGQDEDADDDDKIGFQRDEIIPLTRDADVGEVFGTSRIEAVSDRIEGLKQKLDDNDEAIASKAYPLWLFMFGTEEEPWDSDDINQFMKAHEMENFHPGMKQGVRGDVSVETVSGEVAEIADYLEFDIQWIMASMPMPMFVLGSFGRTLAGAQFQGMAQQQDVLRQIEEARRELEQEFTPMLKDIARQKGYGEDEIDSLRLRFGQPGQVDPEVRQSQQTIRYISDANDAKDPETPRTMKKATGQGPGMSEMPGQQPQTGAPAEDPEQEQQMSAEEASMWQDVWAANSMEELEAAVQVDESREDNLSGVVSNLFLKARDRTLDQIGERYETNPTLAPVELERIANTNLRRVIQEADLRAKSRDIIKAELEEVYDEYGSDQQQQNLRFGNSYNAEFFAQNVENAVRDATEEMLRQARVIVRKGVASDDDWNDVRARIENQFNDAQFEQRADLIAHMELKTAVEATKLEVFEQNNSIVGVRVHNPDASTPVTKSAHGAEAFFNVDQEIDEQLAEQVDESTLRQGFNPLPKVPPYHYNDTTTLKPIYENEAQT